MKSKPQVMPVVAGTPLGKAYGHVLDAATDKILAHKPKPKSKPARKRARRAKKIAKTAVSPLESELRKYVSQEDIDENHGVLEDIERNGPRS